MPNLRFEIETYRTHDYSSYRVGHDVWRWYFRIIGWDENGLDPYYYDNKYDSNDLRFYRTQEEAQLAGEAYLEKDEGENHRGSRGGHYNSVSKLS